MKQAYPFSSKNRIQLILKPSVICLMACITIFSVSCKKDGVPVSQQLVGKWTITSQYNYVHVNGQESSSPFETDPGSYFDFTSTGTVNIKMSESAETAYHYSLQENDTKIIFTKEGSSSKIFNINKIGASNLELADRLEQAGTANYSETRIVFSK